MLAAPTTTRLTALRKELHPHQAAAYLAYATGAGESAGHIRYLTGWMPPTSEVLLLVPADGTPVLVSNDKNRARAFAQVLGEHIRVLKTTTLVDTFAQVLRETLPAGARIATAGRYDLTLARDAELSAALSPYDTHDGDHVLTALRSHRTEHEADRARAAVRVADAMVQQAMRTAMIPGVTGADIMAEVEYTGRRLGAERATCWLAIGNRPAETYFELFELATSLTPDARVQIGTTVLVDGHFSQVLRIGAFKEPSARLTETAQALVAMQDAALAAMKPGRPVHEIGDVLETLIDDFCPYERAADPFRFQSCHAMGNSYSEPWSAPFLFADRDRSHDSASPAIEPHHIYEIHPNFTLPDLGHVCAGDVALVTEDGAQWISQTPRGILRLG